MKFCVNPILKNFQKKANISKINQPTKNDEGAGCIYTLVLQNYKSKFFSKNVNISKNNQPTKK